MNPFEEYAAYYDLFYDEKDYAGECDYLCRHFGNLNPDSHSLLELGVGTGRHAVNFHRMGFAVDGVDISPGMLARAGQACRSEGDIRLHLGDVRTIRLDKVFDIVLSLFHVASYQLTIEDLNALFTTARLHLRPGGVFLFDVWYAPAVLNLQPEPRVRTIRSDGLMIRREATPTHLPQQRRVDVVYHFRVERSDMNVHIFSETHMMRYFDLQEIDQALDRAGFERIFAEEWPTAKPLTEMTWSACIGAKVV